MTRFVKTLAALAVAIMALPGVAWAAETTVRAAACCCGCCGHP
jgi:hypothetical protein